MKNPGLILGSSAKETIEANVGKKAISPASSNAVTSILVSRADKRIYVLQNGNIVAQGDANIKDPGKAIGSNVFVWQGGDPNGSTWDGMGFHADAEGATAPNTAVLERIEGSPDVMDAHPQAHEARDGTGHHRRGRHGRHQEWRGLRGYGRPRQVSRVRCGWPR